MWPPLFRPNHEQKERRDQRTSIYTGIIVCTRSVGSGEYGEHLSRVGAVYIWLVRPQGRGEGSHDVAGGAVGRWVDPPCGLYSSLVRV